MANQENSKASAANEQGTKSHSIEQSLEKFME